MSTRDDNTGAGGKGNGPGAQDADQLIDAAARAMTRGEPSSLLRVRVRGRITGRRTWRTVPVWIPAAGIAALVLGVVITRWPSTPPVANVTVQVPVAPRVTAAPAPEQPERRPQQERSARVGRSERIERIERSEPERVERLAPLLEPLVIEPLPPLPLIAVDTTAAVMPIEIEPLQIEPLQLQ